MRLWCNRLQLEEAEEDGSALEPDVVIEAQGVVEEDGEEDHWEAQALLVEAVDLWLATVPFLEVEAAMEILMVVRTA